MADRRTFASATTLAMGSEVFVDLTFRYSMARDEFRQVPSENGCEFPPEIIGDYRIEKPKIFVQAVLNARRDLRELLAERLLR